MFEVGRDLETICALATPAGHGALAIIRLSGPQALAISRQISVGLPTYPETHRSYLCRLMDKDGECFDEALLTYFAEKKSFTGDETVEFSTHGSSEIVSQLLKNLVSFGAKTAEPGEFTYRAFLNQKIDLVQAESVLSLIQSHSMPAAKQALRQLRGDFSIEIENWISELTWGLAHIEASLDFSEEGLETVSSHGLLDRLLPVQAQIQKRLNQYHSGRLVQEGVRLAIVGEPNVGKSSLLNVLLEEDRAIVTDIAGTTRDTIDATILISGLPVTIVDTAGLRETVDLVEQKGIERSRQAIEKADAVFVVIEAQKILSTIEDKPLQIDPILSMSANDQQIKWLVVNKIDLVNLSEAQKVKIAEFLHTQGLIHQERVLFASTFDKESCRHILVAAIEGWLNPQKGLDQSRLFQARHFELLSNALEYLQQGLVLLENKVSPELVAFEMKEALLCLQKVLGHHYDDQILDRVFKEFCLGK